MSLRATRERRLVVTLSLTLLALVGTIAAVTTADRRTSVDVATAAPSPDGVSRLAIERPGRETLVLERVASGAGPDAPAASVGPEPATGRGDDAGDWRIVAPCAIDAIDARVAPLLDALAGARLDYAAGEVDLEAAGLVEPLATVRLDGTSVALGEPDLGGERRYALVDDRVALVPEWTLSLVEGGLSALAEPALFEVAPTRVVRLDVVPGSDTAPAESTDENTRDDGTVTAGAADDLDAPDDASPPDGSPLELDPRPWSTLAASQVVTWPVTDAPATTRRARLEATLASGETRVVTLIGTESWNAVPNDDGACARLFADAELPSDAYP